MSKKYAVVANEPYIRSLGLKVGDIVTKIEGFGVDIIFELPEHLHGKGHNANIYDKHLKLKEPNYVYLSKYDLEEIEENEE